jgi:phage tail P2-like protein
MSDCISLLPPNSTDTERATECATARLGDISVPTRTLWDPANCPADLLPWLAWAFSVDNWDSRWPEAKQRQVVAQALAIHKHKGTAGALRRALDALGYNITLTEWYQEQPAGLPYTFRADVVITDTGLDDATQREIERVILSTKNVRSHLSSINLIGQTTGYAYVSGWEQSFDAVEVLPYMITEAEVPSSPFYVGATASVYDVTTVRPQ